MQAAVAICGRHPEATGVGAALVQDAAHVLDGLRCDDPSLASRLRQRRPHALVAAACPDRGCAAVLGEAAERAGIPSWSYSIVLPPADLPEPAARTATRLAARARRLESTPVISPERTTAWFGFSRQVATRRGLFTRSTWQVREVIPHIEAARCRAAFGCHRCAEACPYRAIRFQHGVATIEQDTCTGCGICVGACPLTAVTHPMADPGPVEQELAILLRDAPHPRLVAFCCRHDRVGLPAPCLDVPLPCGAATSISHVLDAFRHGADGVAIVLGQGRCPHHHPRPMLIRQHAALQRLLRAAGLDPRRAALADSRDDLCSFIQTVTPLPPREASGKTAAPTEGGVAWPARFALLLGDTPPASPVLGDGEAPLALVECNATRCTLCGACANACPTGALRSVQGSEQTSLTFEHAICPGCRRCEEICPEQALHVRQGIAPGMLHGPLVLAEDALHRCRVCGEAFAPRALLRSVEARTAGRDANWRNLHSDDLCPRCRLPAHNHGRRPDPACIGPEARVYGGAEGRGATVLAHAAPLPRWPGRSPCGHVRIGLVRPGGAHQRPAIRSPARGPPPR